MTETETNGRQPPWGVGAEGEEISFGGWLRRQREIREIPLREIADVTKISMRYLEALESDRFDVLPAPVFAKGFLREYSRYVGLDPDEVVNSYLIAQQSPEELDETDSTVGEPMAGRSWPISTTFLGGVVVVLLGVIALLVFLGGRLEEKPATELPPITAPPAIVPARVPSEPAPDPGPLVPLLVTMDFTDSCWVEFVADDGQRVSELRVQGESIRIEAQEKVLLTLGNPDGVRIEVNGTLFTPPVRPGRVARDVLIDLATATEVAGTEATGEITE